jgi:predicted RNA binding protein YcfA (HicA-like mRNA interferase family)
MAAMYADLVKHLKAGGCWFVRTGKGSHEIWFSPVNGRTFTVPRSLASAPLANAILKQAGLPKAF